MIGNEPLQVVSSKVVLTQGKLPTLVNHSPDPLYAEVLLYYVRDGK